MTERTDPAEFFSQRLNQQRALDLMLRCQRLEEELRAARLELADVLSQLPRPEGEPVDPTLLQRLNDSR